jgi:hypothetical protein
MLDKYPYSSSEPMQLKLGILNRVRSGCFNRERPRFQSSEACIPRAPINFLTSQGSIIKKVVLRAFFSSLLSVVTVATLLWGGCVSCPQFFMFPAAKKDCCKAGHCEKSKSHKSTPEKACNRMPLGTQGFVQVHADLPATIVAAADLLGHFPPNRLPAFMAPAPVEHSPPELHVLNATFLI